MTSAERRLAKIEAALDPTALVLRWIAEAHAHDDLSAYIGALLETGPDSFPMDRLAREAKAGATQRNRGRPRPEVDQAVRTAIIETIFRVQLALRINVLAQEFVELEVLVQAALSAYFSLAADEHASPAAYRATIGLVRCRDLLLRRVTELHCVETARCQVEARFFDGAPVLFPAGLRAWEEHRTQSERMAVMATRLTELDGHDPPLPEDAAAIDARIAQLAADHVEPARLTAYNELGDGRRALAIAISWLRPKLANAATGTLHSASEATPTR
ncbi:MAG: hypothetical protein H0W81_06375 [Chloroflexi bacterium]|nr:hypothetical protein [Chloroflexota bacterium]